MSKQVLIINVTRMGDLVQTIPLLGRLHHEWPGVAIDLIVDRTFAPMAALLPGIRHVLAYDFQGLMDQCRTMAKDVVTLFREFSAWTRPLVGTKYDRVINLTFTRRSGLLAAHIGASDIRGVTTTPDGVSILHNPWMTYFADMHRHRRFNRFNLVDLYALGGSGPGPHAPLTLSIKPDAREWAERFLHTNGNDAVPIAVQIGASDAMKAWRPEYFGRTMAILSRQVKTTFVLIGSKGEAEAVQQAVTAYRGAGGVAMIHDAAGQTDLPKLAALLAQCRLLLTNDTGPMHVAVGVGTSVIDLSIGHVDFNETGPYGRGHWAVQPDLGCAPCGFDQVCPHHACKDRLIPDQMASLCLHVLGVAAFPDPVTGVRLYESGIDEDGLACYRLRAGRMDPTSEWYGTFWRKYWYETFTGQLSKVRIDEPPPDFADQKALFRNLDPVVTQLVKRSHDLVQLCKHRPLPVQILQSTLAEVAGARRCALEEAVPSPAFGPTTVALLRELQNGDGMELSIMAEQQASAYQTWSDRLRMVVEQLDSHLSISPRRRVLSASTRIPLLMP
jgi:ADP-heptose:LPS heptosyltransferase